MPIYLLEQTYNISYDTFNAKVIRAKNVSEARTIANQHTRAEGKIWTNLIHTKCTIIRCNGKSAEILSSFNAN